MSQKMIRIPSVVLGALGSICMLEAGCGASGDAPSSAALPPANSADVVVTLDGVRHECVVALSREQHGSSVACGDIVPFLKDELRLQAGATYAVRAGSGVSDEELVGVKQNLQRAGYRPVDGR